MSIILRNGKLVMPERVINNGSLKIAEGKIVDIFINKCSICTGGLLLIEPQDIVVDAGGDYIAPGFIDTHTHGGGGHDFMDGTVDAIIGACQGHLQFGTTSIVPTTLTSTEENLFNTLDNISEARKKGKGAKILGLHLEGPYFSKKQKGAQDPRYIKNPDREEYLKILNYSDDIVRWTIAPELEGALEMASILRERGIICSIGHSDAVYEEVLKAFECGFTHITHLYSGMSMVKRINAFRYSGVVESAYLIDELTVEIIADGKHLPASLLKLIYKMKSPDKICLVTDSMRAAGMPEGEYILGSKQDGQKIVVEDEVGKLMDRSAFASSVATSNRLVRTMVELADVPLNQAVKMMTLTPARIMGIDNRKGSLAIGKDADVIVFDNDINIKIVIAGGEIFYDLKGEQ